MQFYLKYTTAFLLNFFASQAMGAEISIQAAEMKGSDRGLYHEHIVDISLTGPINPGDAQIFRSVLISLIPDYYPNALSRIIVHLESDGGSFAEGIELMRIFRELGIGTNVRNDARCLSACAIAFMGGTVVNEASLFQTYRGVEPGAELGFHAPSLDVNDSAMVPSGLLQTSYAAALGALGELIGNSKEFDIDTTLLQIISSTPPNEMYILETVDDFARWNIHVDIPGDWKPDRNDLARICSNFFYWAEGKSVLNGALPYRKENQNSWAKRMQFVNIPNQYGRVQKFAYVQTLEYEYNEYCVLNLSRGPGVMSTTSTPDSAIRAIITSNTFLPQAYQLHALPADFVISRIKR